MKRNFIITMGLLFVFAVVLTACGSKQNDFITVTGSGKAEISPDYIQISALSSVLTPEYKQAMQKNAEIMEKAYNFLASILDKDDSLIKTLDYSISEEKVWENNKSVSKGYRCNNSFEIKIPISKKIPAEKVISGLMDCGVDQISGVNYIVENSEKYEGDALAAALKNAREKANQTAKADNRRAGRAMEISEQEVYTDAARNVAYQSVMMESKSGSGDVTTAGRRFAYAKVTVKFKVR